MRHILPGIAFAAAALVSLVSPAGAGTLDKIKTSGTIIIGYRADASPFSSEGAGGKPEGFSIDLCNGIVAATKSALQVNDLGVKYVPVTAANRIEKLESGEVDIECGSTTRTLSREEHADFTLLIFVTGADLLVPIDSKISSPADLAGRKVAVLPGTTTETVLASVLKQRAIDATVVRVKDHQDGLVAITDGRADAYASDQAILIGLALKTTNPHLFRLSGTIFSYEPYALMVRRDDSAFRLVADRALAQIYRSGQIWDIYKRWFGLWSADPSDLLVALYQMQSLSD
jgi:glutamate/aspartate transport system substrate-binding protein